MYRSVTKWISFNFTFIANYITAVFVVIGICYGLPVGSNTITLTSEIGSSQSHMHIGYATHASRFYVEELGQPTWSTGNYQ